MSTEFLFVCYYCEVLYHNPYNLSRGPPSTAMPIKYVGKTTDFCGKPLWEILGNLKNMGVGRLVTRNMHRRYKEPCFYRILKAEPLEPPKEFEDRKVRCIVERVFRGQRDPIAIEMERQSYKSDFRLVPKHEEAALWKAVEETKAKQKILPSTIDLPPLLRHIYIEEMKASGQPPVVPKLKLKINIYGGLKNYRLAEEGETPNVVLDYHKTNQPHLYKIPDSLSK